MAEEMKIIRTIAENILPTCKFVIDDYNYDVISSLIQYFNGDSEFEKDGLNGRKGILLAGNIGSGKSILIKIFKRYCFYMKFKHQFRIEFSDNITDKFARDGYNGINLFMGNSFQNGNNVINSKPICLCIDDLGVEKEIVKHYGTEEAVIEKILTSRYELFQKGIITHATTNLGATMLREKYGTRIYSRIKEMFNYIILPGEDRRA